MQLVLAASPSPGIPGGFRTPVVEDARAQFVMLPNDEKAAIDTAVFLSKQYIRTFDLGAGNWTGGWIRSNDDELIGRISYNGTFNDHEALRKWYPGCAGCGNVFADDECRHFKWSYADGGQFLCHKCFEKDLDSAYLQQNNEIYRELERYTTAELASCYVRTRNPHSLIALMQRFFYVVKPDVIRAIHITSAKAGIRSTIIHTDAPNAELTSAIGIDAGMTIIEALSEWIKDGSEQKWSGW